MPVYEYYCTHCEKRFDALRPMSQANAPIPCPRCNALSTQKMLSTFAAVSRDSGGSRLVAGSATSGCSACAGGNCASCGSN